MVLLLCQRSHSAARQFPDFIYDVMEHVYLAIDLRAVAESLDYKRNGGVIRVLESRDNTALEYLSVIFACEHYKEVRKTLDAF